MNSGGSKIPQQKLTLLLVACTITFAFVWQYQGYGKGKTSKDQAAGSDSNTTCAIVCSRDISKGSVLQEDDLELVNIIESNLPLDAVNYGTIPEGRMLTNDLKKGSLVRLHDIGLTMIPNYLPRIPYKSLRFVPSLPLVHAARPLSQGIIIGLSDLEITTVPINKIPPNSLISPYDAIGRKTAFSLDKGEILYRTDVGLDLQSR